MFHLFYKAICSEPYEKNAHKIDIVKITFNYKETINWLNLYKIPLLKCTEEFPLGHHIQILNFLLFQNSPTATFQYLNEFIAKLKYNINEDNFSSYEWKALIDKAYDHYTWYPLGALSCCTELLEEFPERNHSHEKAPSPTLPRPTTSFH